MTILQAQKADHVQVKNAHLHFMIKFQSGNNEVATRILQGLRIKKEGEPFSHERRWCFPPTQLKVFSFHTVYEPTRLGIQIALGTAYSFCKATYKNAAEKGSSDCLYQPQTGFPKAHWHSKKLPDEIQQFPFQLTRRNTLVICFIIIFF